MHKILLYIICLISISAGNVYAQEAKLPFEAVKDYRELAERAIVETTKGKFEITFYRQQAPITTKNFIYLAQKGFYNNLTFHRHDMGFVLQGGDPKGNGTGGPGYTLPPEFSMLRHVRGTLGMARKPDQVNPERNSNGSQFYITLDDARHLDGTYTVFAQVSKGMEIVETLRKGDSIISISFPEN